MKREFSCSDKETLIAYIYGECEAADREAVEAHLATCAECTEEVSGLGGVRRTLAEWQPPLAPPGFRLVREADAPAPQATVLRPARWWRRPLPKWAQAAAALLLFAGGAGLANLDVQYGADGLRIRTGWQHQAPAPVTSARVADAASPSSPSATAPWRNDVVALERQVQDLSAQLASVRAVAGQPAGLNERQLMSRVRTLVDSSIGESERRQQREMATRVAQVQGEWGVQRRADLVRLQQGLGWVQGQTGAEVAQQRQLINYLLTVSQKR